MSNSKEHKDDKDHKKDKDDKKNIEGFDDYYNNKENAKIDNNGFYKENFKEENKLKNNTDVYNFNNKTNPESSITKENETEYNKRIKKTEEEEFNTHDIKYININGENVEINKLAITDVIIDQILEDKEKHIDILSAKFDYEKAKFHFLANQIYRKDIFDQNESKFFI